MATNCLGPRPLTPLLLPCLHAAAQVRARATTAMPTLRHRTCILASPMGLFFTLPARCTGAGLAAGAGGECVLPHAPPGDGPKAGPAAAPALRLGCGLLRQQDRTGRQTISRVLQHFAGLLTDTST
jgi:hypothetical protein